MDDEVVMEMVGGGLALVGYIAWDRYRIWRQKQRQQDFRPRYDAFLIKHGELYEKVSIPMGEADRKKVARNYNFMLGLFSLFGVLFFFLLFANPPDSQGEYLSGIAFAAFISLGIWLFLREKKKILRANEKKISKGVITDKIRDADNFYFEISGREKILISRQDYKRYSFGDIVKIEVLGNSSDIAIKRTIGRIGKI